MQITEPVFSVETRTRLYPDMPLFSIGWTFGDKFQRGALNPTGALALYASSTNGSSAVSILNLSNLRLATGATINSDCDVRMNGLGIGREPLALGAGITHTIRQRFNLSGVLTIQCFVGMETTLTDSALTALPTTQRHIGIVLDTGVNGNWHISSGNGTDQVLTDTGVLATTGQWVVQLTYDGNNSCLLELFLEDATVASFSSRIDDIGSSSVRTYLLHWFLENLAAANRTLDGSQWVDVIS